MSFSQPAAGGDNFTAADHNGHLLLIYPKHYNPDEPTTKGNTQAADVDVIVVDKLGPNGQPLVFKDARIFGNLARSVRNDLGGKVLGRLGQGPNTKGTPPWILQNYTDADVAMATPVAAAFEAGQFAQPTAPNPMAQGAPYGAAPQTPPAAAPQQWQQAPAAAPAQQWQAPAPTGQPAAPAAAPAPAGGAADPALLAHLAQYGINLPPTTPQAQAEAIAATLPQ